MKINLFGFNRVESRFMESCFEKINKGGFNPRWMGHDLINKIPFLLHAFFIIRVELPSYFHIGKLSHRLGSEEGKVGLKHGISFF